ncbi:hypothetical protein [Candidatus Nitrososphaera evergladensis]|uniref:hypothetical protein n=1 Tax=Candidatus Nitrososphaera evergladensis TaxID=1459637 RepID=UPI0011E5B2D7|nr:hypothetical protein [Candidatus Nitrososphaera evergladensis]
MQQDAKKPSVIGSGVTKSLRLGKRLHAALAIARPQPEQHGSAASFFPTDTLLAYDLEIITEVEDGIAAAGKRLADLGLASGENSISYYLQDSSLPTFFIKGDDKGPLNLLHGSCRKLHGKGEDCFAAADKVISKSFADIGNRPSALFLTGDQIYADDVAVPLARYLTEFGVALLGWEERIDGVDEKISDIAPGTRQKLVEKYAGFTSGQAENHLLAFGEFAAMYMLAWNEENWPVEFPDIASIPDNRQEKYRDQIKHLEEARRDLAAVRRVLANIPTYMIFDDHDVTDDWNITREWHDNAKYSKCGKQVIANALLAYWVFQGWGNDPSLYDPDFIGRISNYLGKNGDATAEEKTLFEDLFLNFHGWTFGAPTKPLAIFTDSRTQRHYDSFRGPPQLIGKDGLTAISRVAQLAGYKKGDPIIIVSAAPVLGFYLFEALQKALAVATSIYALDLETWYANTKVRTRFLSFLAREFAPRRCIIMSGDVHFGFTTRAAIAFSQENPKDMATTINVTQLTSSALKTTSLVKIAFISDILGRIRQLFPFKRIVRVGHAMIDDGGGGSNSDSGARRIDWIEARAIVRTAGSPLSPLIISDNNIGLVTIEKDLSVIHKLIVRKGGKDSKVYEAIAKMDRSPLEESLRARMLRRS